MRPLRLLVVTGALILSFLQDAGAEKRPTAIGVRVTSLGEAFEVAIAFTSIPRYRIFSLAEPDRIVIDLDEVHFRVPVDAGGGPVKSVRTSLLQPGTSRLVMDLFSPYAVADVSVFPGLGELVLQLLPQSRSDAIERSGKVVAATKRVGMPASITPNPKPAPPVVIADPGHSGPNSGAIGLRSNL